MHQELAGAALYVANKPVNKFRLLILKRFSRPSMTGTVISSQVKSSIWGLKSRGGSYSLLAKNFQKRGFLMARRTNKAESTFIALLLIVGLPIYGLFKLFETSGWIIPSSIIITLFIFIYLYKRNKKQKRLAYLRDKYKNESIVQKIYNGNFWVGQTTQQLTDSLGDPEGIDNKLLKTKVKEVWKYNRKGVNRFALKINIENGRVIGWDQKS